MVAPPPYEWPSSRGAPRCRRPGRILATLRTDVPVFSAVEELEWRRPTLALPALRPSLGSLEMFAAASRSLGPGPALRRV